MGSLEEEYPVNAGVPKGSIVGPTLFILYINDLPNDVTCNIAIYTNDTTLYSKCEQASDLCANWGRKSLADFNTGKTQLVSFDQSNNTGAIDKKMDEFVLEEKSYFKMLGLTFSSKLD